MVFQQPQPEIAIYREDALAIIEAPSDIVVDVRWIRRVLEGLDEEDEEEDA